MRRYCAFAATAAVLAALLALSVTGGEAAASASRALALVAILGAGAVAIRSRRARAAAPLCAAVIERHSLGRETGVAVVSAEGRRLLVGFGPGGVALLRELGRPDGERAP